METLRRAVLAELAVIGNRDRRAGPLLSSSLVLSLISLFSSKGDGGGGRGGGRVGAEGSSLSVDLRRRRIEVLEGS